MEEQRFIVFINDNAPILSNHTGIVPVETIKGKNYLLCSRFENEGSFVTLTISPCLETNNLGSDISLIVPANHIEYVVSVPSEEVRKIPGFLGK